MLLVKPSQKSPYQLRDRAFRACRRMISQRRLSLGLLLEAGQQLAIVEGFNFGAGDNQKMEAERTAAAKATERPGVGLALSCCMPFLS